MLLIFSGVIKIVLLAVFIVAVVYVKSKIEADCGMFEWLESPSRIPYWKVLFLVIASSLAVWLLTRKLIAGQKLYSPASVSLRSTFGLMQSVTSFVWLLFLTLGIGLFFHNPPAKSIAEHRVAIFSVEKPANQSKPHKTYFKVSSWRDKEHETLLSYRIDYKTAQLLREAHYAKVVIGKDWLGNLRVLRLLPMAHKTE